MQIRKSLATITGAISLCFLALLFMPYAATETKAQNKAAAKTSALDGKQIAFDRRKGNCLACHEVPGGSLPGNIGPPLKDMKARYSERKALRDQIWDATVANPSSIMPPFGRHGILTDDELEAVVDFIYSL